MIVIGLLLVFWVCILIACPPRKQQQISTSATVHLPDTTVVASRPSRKDLRSYLERRNDPGHVLAVWGDVRIVHGEYGPVIEFVSPPITTRQIASEFMAGKPIREFSVGSTAVREQIEGALRYEMIQMANMIQRSKMAERR
jgi:hypothetical protein